MIIHVDNLKLRTVIGVNDWERQTRQDVVIRIEMELDGSKAGESDDLADTVDYKALTDRIAETVEQSSYQLLEALAAKVLEQVLEAPKVERARVRVDKPHALSRAETVAVTCEGTCRPSTAAQGGVSRVEPRPDARRQARRS